MDEALLLGVVDRTGDLAGDAQGELHRARRPFLAQYGSAGQVFHGDVVIIADPADVVDTDDMAMVQPRGDLGLAQESLAKVRIDQQGRRHDLERDFAVHGFLDRQIHGSHAAAPELAQQSVSGNFDHEGSVSMHNAALQRKP